jgi:hypothetical protein
MLAHLQPGNRLQMPAVFITDWKSVEKIFDRQQTDALKICSPLRPDAFDELKGDLKEVRHEGLQVPGAVCWVLGAGC